LEGEVILRRWRYGTCSLLLFTFFLLPIQRKVLVEANADPTLIKKQPNFLIYKEIQMVSGAKSYMSKEFPILRKCAYFVPFMRRPLCHM
jgi:hypothetical protein